MRHLTVDAVVAMCLLSGGISVAQQRRAQAELRESERRIAANQATQIRQAEERSAEQRRAMAEADRRREAEQHREEFLAQVRARAEQSSATQTEAAVEAPASKPQETVAAPPSLSVSEQLPRRYSLMREAGLAVMIGASLAALFVLGRIAKEWRTR